MKNFVDHEMNICCRECDRPMLGIKHVEARHTCHECGGYSLIALEQLYDRVLTKTYRHRAVVGDRQGGAA